MAQSGTTMVEVGTTNRTHLRDYERAITEKTGVVLRVHPSNYRVVGFTSRPELKELVELAHARNLPLVDDLGAGALVGLEQFGLPANNSSKKMAGLPHEPTVAESISAGADVALFSADKLIGASQGGIIVGRKELIDRIRKHPLARAFRVDKVCLMAIERTLHLFRDPARLAERHPLYRMLTTPMETLQTRAQKLADALTEANLPLTVAVERGVGYLGSGSLPMHELPTMTVTLSSVPTDAKGEKLSAAELSRRLRMDQAAVFTRIENDKVVLDMRTVAEEQIVPIISAIGRVI
jgi:L-seryl-tRNA(Ser) seleniumtransferase